jgi:putative ubiquitin-RnfH superfamily antitoxin RatB of RatAB toxin-antitoxin module
MNTIDVWLYGPLARYGTDARQRGYAHLQLRLPEGSTMRDLLERLGIPGQERGITLVNGKLAALAGLEADLDIGLHDGDRVGIFHRKSMWPFQYRFGAHLTPELERAFKEREDRGVRHAYTEGDSA